MQIAYRLLSVVNTVWVWEVEFRRFGFVVFGGCGCGCIGYIEMMLRSLFMLPV